MDTCVSTSTITTDQLYAGATPVTDPYNNNVYLVPCSGSYSYASTTASTTDIVGVDLVTTYFDLCVLWVGIFVLMIWLARQFTL